jgi:hypothetical protein
LGTWSKNYWADCESWFFLNLIFMSVRILSFKPIHSVIKKMFHKGPVAARHGASEMALHTFSHCSISAILIFARNET